MKKKSFAKTIRKAARNSKRKLIDFRQGDSPNIVLIAAVRGGSTLVADMLAAQQGMWFYSEPFSPRRRAYLGPQLQSLSIKQSRQDCRFFDLNRGQNSEMLQLMSQLNHAVLPTGTSRRTYFPLKSDRICLKVLRASWLTDTFAEQGMQIILVIRHPAAQALSVMRLGWKFSAEIYFKKIDFLENFFSQEQIIFGNKILTEGSAFQKAVLSWVCDIIYPLKFSEKVSCQLFYEHLISEPELCLGYLSQTLNIKDTKIMAHILSKPTFSSKLCTKDTIQAINLGDSQLLLKKWCSQLSDTDCKAGQEILDCFDINCYSMYDIMPKMDVK